MKMGPPSLEGTPGPMEVGDTKEGNTPNDIAAISKDLFLRDTTNEAFTILRN
jgi:hypothetical protein